MEDTALERPSGRERRSFFRINDSVALRLKVVESDPATLAARTEEFRQQFGRLPSMQVEDAKLRTQLVAITSRHPEIGAYMKALNARIEDLTRLVMADVEPIAEQPTHNVNLSAQGIRLHCDEELAQDATVELRLQLFPSKLQLLVHGEVVWCRRRGAPAGRGWTAAIEFKHLHELEREALVRHVHQRQLAGLRTRNSETRD